MTRQLPRCAIAVSAGSAPDVSLCRDCAFPILDQTDKNESCDEGREGSYETDSKNLNTRIGCVCSYQNTRHRQCRGYPPGAQDSARSWWQCLRQHSDDKADGYRAPDNCFHVDHITEYPHCGRAAISSTRLLGVERMNSTERYISRQGELEPKTSLSLPRD